MKHISIANRTLFIFIVTTLVFLAASESYAKELDFSIEPSKSRLDAKGLLPKNDGWFPDKINSKLDAVILGMHAKGDNPELLRAKELELKIYSYPEFLFEQSRNKTRVVIGGSHGEEGDLEALAAHLQRSFRCSISPRASQLKFIGEGEEHGLRSGVPYLLDEGLELCSCRSRCVEAPRAEGVGDFCVELFPLFLSLLVHLLGVEMPEQCAGL